MVPKVARQVDAVVQRVAAGLFGEPPVGRR
jgi:hypothetical protein